MNTEEKKNRSDIIKGALVNITGIIAKSLNFVFFIVLGRLYGPEITGLYLVSWTAIDIISKLSIMGLDRSLIAEGASAAAKNESHLHRKIAHALKIAFYTSVIIFTVTEISAPFIAEDLLNNNSLTTSIRIMSFGLFFWTFSAITIAASRSARIMKYEIFVKSISEPVVMLIFSVVLYYSGLGVTALAVSFVISTFLGTVSSLYLFSRKFSVSKTLFYIKHQDTGWKDLFKKSFPTGIYDMLNLLLQRIDLYILTGFTSAATAGIYGIASEIAFSVKKVRQSFDPIFIPVASDLLEKDNKIELSGHFRTVTRWIFTVDVLLLSIFFLSGSSIISLFGTEFSTGYTAMVILTVSILINGTFGLGELFILIRNPWINIFNSIGAIAINLTLAFLLIPSHGMVGAAISITVTYFIINMFRIIEVSLIYGLSPFSQKMGTTLICAVAAIIPPALLKFYLPAGIINDIALSALYILLFFFCLKKSGSTPEIHSLSGKRRKL